MIEVFTDEWAAACCQRLNERDAYRTAAATWEWAMVLVMSADPAAGVESDRAVYIDAHRGACRGAYVAGGEEAESAPYVLRADPATWKRLLDRQIEPVSAVMMGKLKLVRGSLMVIAKHAAAAKEMIAAAADVGGAFPAR